MDINNYSYTPHMLEDANDAPSLTREEYLKSPYCSDRERALDFLYTFRAYRKAPTENKNAVYDYLMNAYREGSQEEAKKTIQAYFNSLLNIAYTINDFLLFIA